MAPNERRDLVAEREVRLSARAVEERNGACRLGMHGVAQHADERRDADSSGDEHDGTVVAGWIRERTVRTADRQRRAGREPITCSAFETSP